MESLLREGIAEAKSGAKSMARRYFERVIDAGSNRDHDTLAEAWFWLGEISDDPAEKRQALENALSHDLNHARARRALALLNGQIKPDELVDADALPAPRTEPVQADARRFICPKCGGRMTFAPDGKTLVCEYCMRRETLPPLPGEPAEQDFITAMATMRGHGAPAAQQFFRCKGCGAEFILPPTQISSSCPYCRSPHAVRIEKSGELVAPAAILPHRFDERSAGAHLLRWMTEHKIRPDIRTTALRGMYVPVWTFDLGGAVKYTGQANQGRGRRGEADPGLPVVEDEYPIHVNDLAVPACRNIAATLRRLLPGFHLEHLERYDASYLAGWPAQIYDIPMSDASLEARAQAYQRFKEELPARLSPLHILSTASSGITVESFRLALLPVWITRLLHPGREEVVLINGQDGEAASHPSSKKGLFGWLAGEPEG
ncbi:MAG: hypothetical protein ACM3QS_09670 [Bacteroidota bacterium]